jgi:hypothetical protein
MRGVIAAATAELEDSLNRNTTILQDNLAVKVRFFTVVFRGSQKVEPIGKLVI